MCAPAPVRRFRPVSFFVIASGVYASAWSARSNVAGDRIRRQPSAARQAEPGIALKLDDRTRARDARAVHVPQPDDRAADAAGSRPPRGVTLDIQFRPAVLARRSRMLALAVRVRIVL